MFRFNKRTKNDRDAEIDQRGLQAKLDEVYSKVAYVAMMTDTEFPEVKETSDGTEVAKEGE